MKFYQIALPLIACASLSCKKGVVENADLKYGHLKEGGWTSNTIWSMTPRQFKIDRQIAYGVKVSVCDDTVDKKFGKQTVKAFDEWLGPFAEYFLVKQNCLDQPTVTIDDKQKCLIDTAIAETFPVPKGKKKSWIIRMCKPEKVDYQVILHEVGHLFGQCDRYNKKSDDNLYHPQMGANCDDSKLGTNGVFDKLSAMQVPGELHPGVVTKDDVEGVVEFVKRSDIPKNIPWQLLFDRDLKGWRDLNSSVYKDARQDLDK